MFCAAAGLVFVIWLLRLLSEWPACLIMGVLWVLGASFYFYEAIAGMTNPPMEWGYPRTVEGFFHALTRGSTTRSIRRTSSPTRACFWFSSSC
jgi:hypothetical protein